jgi:hypothetical protein
MDGDFAVYQLVHLSIATKRKHPLSAAPGLILWAIWLPCRCCYQAARSASTERVVQLQGKS